LPHFSKAYCPPPPLHPFPTRRSSDLRELINLASYNYLGISYRPEVRQSAIEALQRYGLGASGSPILSGTFDIHVQLAEAIALQRDRKSTRLNSSHGSI